MCVFVALGTLHAMRMHRTILFLWPAPLDHIFPHYLIKGAILGTKKFAELKICGSCRALDTLVTPHEMCATTEM